MVLEHGAHQLGGVLVVPFQQHAGCQRVRVQLTTLLARQLHLRPQQHRVDVQHAQVVQETGGRQHADVMAGRPAPQSETGRHPHRAQAVRPKRRMRLPHQRALEGDGAWPRDQADLGQHDVRQELVAEHGLEGRLGVRQVRCRVAQHQAADPGRALHALGQRDAQQLLRQPVEEPGIDRHALVEHLQALGVVDGRAGDHGPTLAELGDGTREMSGVDLHRPRS